VLAVTLPNARVEAESLAIRRPTDDQRRFVCAMADMRMTWEEIRQLIITPTTDELITKTTLARAFKRELADGKAKLNSIIATPVL
jgi:hypothetical protein